MLIFFLIPFFVFSDVINGSAFAAEKKIKLSKRAKKQLVVKGVAAYEKGYHAEAKKYLKKAKTTFPENYAIPYYLGAIYLEEGNRAAAISEWQRYTTMGVASENTLNIQKYLIILLREQTGENARTALSNKTGTLNNTRKNTTIAIFPFKNIGFEVFGPLGKGMADILISDLSLIPDLKVVDRIQLQTILDEIGLSLSGELDVAHVAKAGQLLKASHIITGNLQDIASEKLQILCTTFDTKHNTSTNISTKESELSRFYQLEKELACNIMEKLGKNCHKTPKIFHKVHTQSLQALIAYSWGLDYFDNEKYDLARKMFQKALEEDAKFELAEKALVRTPTIMMKKQSTSQIIAAVSASGIPSDIAGNALVGKKEGISKTTMVIGGLAAVAGGAALAGAGSGSSGNKNDGGTPPPQNETQDFSGVWQVRLNKNTTLKLKLVQSGSSVITGSILEEKGWNCLMADEHGSGEISGPDLSLNIKDVSKYEFTIEGSCSEKCTQMEGTWQISSPLGGDIEPECNLTGNFTSTKNSSGSITW